LGRTNTTNLTIDYTVNVPTKEGYGVVEGLQGYDDFLPIRISYWFLDESNTTCYNQGDQPTGVESPYCNPLTVQTVGQIDTEVEFTVDLRPDLPEGVYNIVRSIEIDPENVWIDYGQEIIGKIRVLASGEAFASLRHSESSISIEGAEDVLKTAEGVQEVENSTMTLESIEAGKTATASIVTDSAISQISLTVRNSVENVRINVRKIASLPSVIPELDRVYSYIAIDKENITDDDINGTTFVFSVNKSWIEENNISAISLNRYTTEWERLPTEKINETGSEISFQAESPGFSYFAITGETANDEKKPEFPLIPVAAATAVVIILLARMFYRSNSAKKTKEA
jgi:PGF-pre-PGF domain-containing protein